MYYCFECFIASVWIFSTFAQDVLICKEIGLENQNSIQENCSEKTTFVHYLENQNKATGLFNKTEVLELINSNLINHLVEMKNLQRKLEGIV